MRPLCVFFCCAQSQFAAFLLFVLFQRMSGAVTGAGLDSPRLVTSCSGGQIPPPTTRRHLSCTERTDASCGPGGP